MAWVETDDSLPVIGSGRPLEDARRTGQVEMVRWLGALYGLDDQDTYQLLTQIRLAPLANVGDANSSAATKVPKSPLPRVEVVDGMHRRLRELATGIG